MKDPDVLFTFLNERAKGRSLSSIAKEVGVSRQTLANWEREHEEEVQNLRAMELDALAEAYWMKMQGRIKLIGESLRRVEEELEQRDLSKVPTAKLFELELKLVNELRKEPSTVSILSEEQIEQAILHRDMYDFPSSVYDPKPKRRTPLFLLEEYNEVEKQHGGADSN